MAMKPPDLSRMKAEVAKAEHGEWCAKRVGSVALDFIDIGLAAGGSPPFDRSKEPRCTCGLSAMRERIERIEGMAIDAGRDAN